MKRFLFPVIFTVAASVAQAATYSTDFDSSPYPAVGTDADLDGLGGWSVTDTSTGFLSFVTAVTPGAAPTTNFGGIGGLFDAPGSATVGVSHAYSSELGKVTYNLRISILDSTNGFANRDSFGIALLNGSSNLFSINLSPSTQTATPDASSNDGEWDMSYTGGTSGPTVGLSQAIIESGFYDLALSFSPDGAGGTNFTLDTTGSDTKSRSGNIAIDPTTVMTAIAFTWNTFDPNPSNSGDNALLFDNISIVPEPSTWMLLGFAGLGIAFRRVRG